MENLGQSYARRDIFARLILGPLFILAMTLAWDTHLSSLEITDAARRNGTLSFARSATSHVDLEAMLELLEIGDENHPSHKEQWAKLNVMLREVKGVKYFYTCYLIGG